MMRYVSDPIQNRNYKTPCGGTEPTSTMTKRLSYLILMLLLMGCEKDRIETITVKIEGKPVNVVHEFHLSQGSMRWSFEGEMEGKVSVCISGCETILEDQFIESCPRVYTLSGKFNIPGPDQYPHGEDYMNAGRQHCFVFIPDESSRGEIRVTFMESRKPVSKFVKNP